MRFITLTLVVFSLFENVICQDNNTATFQGKDSVYSSFISLYHFKFTKSEKTIQYLIDTYPDNPWTKLSIANHDWWKLISGLNNKSIYNDLEQNTNAVIRELRKSEDITNEELYCLLSAYAINARVAVLQKNYLKSVSYLNQSIKYLRKSFGNEEEFPWFYITSGMYNYYIEREKISFPLLYPYLILLPPGDINKGIQQMKKALISNDPVLSTEAAYFYFKILWEEDKDIQGAEEELDKLISCYAGNLLFLYYRFKLSIDANQIIPARNILNELIKTAIANKELDQLQIDHFKELSKIALKNYYLRNETKK